MARIQVREQGHDETREIEFTEQTGTPEDWTTKLAHSETMRTRQASDFRDKAERQVIVCQKMAPSTYHVQTGYRIGNGRSQATLDNLLIVTVYHEGE